MPSTQAQRQNNTTTVAGTYYHGSTCEFENFSFNISGDIGIHLGTLAAAQCFMNSDENYLYTTCIYIKNCYEIPDTGNHDLGTYGQILEWVMIEWCAKNMPEINRTNFWTEADKHFPQELETINMLQQGCIPDVGGLRESKEWFRLAFRKFGVDGFKYTNEHEDEGSVSYICIHEDQMKINERLLVVNSEN
jgi:hypothetical protein